MDRLNLYPDNKVVVLWGNIVFEKSQYKGDWDGTQNGKDLSSGTYYYTIDKGNGSKAEAGIVTIIR